ncbi:MAG: hypothetical protein BWY04_00204 [candidate division CPR1 bacterium ADurb.Bin160]|jgi:hypothetical protein|uniref:Uncharacterized protein n=1 Tax=candidate division CPR1 bacterium ADurb.Bin160 TaxID=1852826 RepID=A0A1V5ZRS8_9BACT|nr:MAG: hypothetical protein BWY04_00204 [candidate division CPR1 bacterium ADurb.Bin160]
MSNNNKYVQELINNSEKLITTTTQLISPEKIKMFSTVMSKKIEFIDLDDKKINLELDNGLNFMIQDVGDINVNINNLIFQEVGVSEENLEYVIKTLVENKYLDKNALIYIPEATDSIIESNELNGNSIFINDNNVFNLDDMQQNINLSIDLSNDKTA